MERKDDLEDVHAAALLVYMYCVDNELTQVPWEISRRFSEENGVFLYILQKLVYDEASLVLKRSFSV